MLKSILNTTALSVLLVSSIVSAKELRTTEYQDWTSVCSEIQLNERCEIQQTLNIENEQGNSRLLLTSVSKIDDQLFMQLLLPLGLDLRSGIVIKIDEGEEVVVGFLSCLQEGCLVVLPLDQTLLAAMRAGQIAKVGFRPFNTSETVVLEMSLKGFTQASQTIN